ncbi:hypothetical protein CDN99_11500 [Roseateles aquatilis]|uniref:Lipoprotein n=1 Tax=Roseateles aquatilis TaxID=431061 RepID=A0A246JDZ9_9BURK|nr:hypothetical protein [Roseateles aquatilis]OWQ90790.1 hypothetical protein CDN99_11500 [Roseateles aquatilis]
MNLRSLPIFRVLALAGMVMTAACQPSVAACNVTTPPEGWAAGSARWDGACAGAQADGLGVLKEQQGAAVKRMFLGRVHKGELSLGVVDIPDQGFAAGRFEQGKLVPTDDRQQIIKAFDEAARAATAAADRFEKAGNAASAKFYRAKAKELREQMD